MCWIHTHQCNSARHCFEMELLYIIYNNILCWNKHTIQTHIIMTWTRQTHTHGHDTTWPPNHYCFGGTLLFVGFLSFPLPLPHTHIITARQHRYLKIAASRLSCTKLYRKEQATANWLAYVSTSCPEEGQSSWLKCRLAVACSLIAFSIHNKSQI